MHTYIHTYMCVCVCVSVCLCVCVCMCVHVCLSVCLSVAILAQGQILRGLGLGQNGCVSAPAELCRGSVPPA